MKLYDTMTAAMKTPHQPVIVKTREFDHKGNKRISITARKANGKREYNIVQYENGKYSEAV